MIEQFINLIKDINWYDIKWINRHGIQSQWQAILPTQLEILRSKIQGQYKPGHPDWHRWQFYFKDIYSPLNRIHFEHGIPKVLRGLGFGFKLYRSLIQQLGYATSEPNSSDMAKKVWQKLAQDPSLKTYTYNNWTLCIADPNKEKEAIEVWQSALRSELGLVLQESIGYQSSVWRTTSKEWLDNLIRNGSIRTNNKKFISVSLDEYSGCQDNYGDVTIEFDRDILEKQGLIEVYYEKEFFDMYPDISKHITGYIGEEDYYSDKDYKTEEEANDMAELSWKDLIETYESEQECVIPEIKMVDGLIKSVSGNISKFSKEWLQKNKIDFKP